MSKCSGSYRYLVDAKNRATAPHSSEPTIDFSHLDHFNSPDDDIDITDQFEFHNHQGKCLDGFV